MIVVFERDANGETGSVDGVDSLYYIVPCNTKEEAIGIIYELRSMLYGKGATPVE